MSTATQVENRFPSQIKYIVGNEASERFSFYGMRSILTIFMIQHLLMPEHEAKAVYHYFVSACYFFPLIGAYISDKLWGKYKTIIYLSLVYCLGHAVLSMFESKMGLYAGLGLIAIGSGGIKPCVSAHVGDQFTEKNKHLLSKVYEIFYFSINFGSTFSTLLIPWILPRYGSQVAFGIPGVLMFIATIIFWMGKKSYVIVPPTKENNEESFLSVLWYSLRNRSKRKESDENFLDVAKQKFSTNGVESAKAVWNIFKVFVLVILFWSLYDQHGSSWVIQAGKMDLVVFGQKWESSQIAALNPIMVMILIPLFSFGFYPWIERTFKLEMTPLRKMIGGMFLTALSFAVVGVFELLLDSGHTLSVAWQVIPYLVITMAEVMVSITGLEFAYTQAPRAMKSTIMSFWMLTISFGNFLTGIVSELNVFSGANFYFFFTALMLVAAVFFYFAATKYKVRDFFETKTSNDPLLNNA